MSRQLIDHSPDLSKLRLEGYEFRVMDAFLLVSSVPYLNASGELLRGTLACELSQQNNTTLPPNAHPIWWQGEYPYNRDGSRIEVLYNSTPGCELIKGFHVQHLFSSKPSGPNALPSGYSNYYDKITTYIGFISAPAAAKYPGVTAKTGRVFPEENEDTPFLYPDTNSSRAEIAIISEKLKGLKIAIVGLGGTGSYILDFVAKTPVTEIHLFDGDPFEQHNSFRTPGAASEDDLDAKMTKVAYLTRTYSKMRNGIVPHEVYLTKATFDHLIGFSFVFVAIDKPGLKKDLFEFLISQKIPFTDVGMGIVRANDSLMGTLRVTTSSTTMTSHLGNRVSFVDEDHEDDYRSNIQIVELNALNAALAVIKWKKIFGFYYDPNQEHHSQFITDELIIHNADYPTPIP